MLNLFILIFLVLGFYTGARRGATLQIVYTIGYVLTFILARIVYKGWGERLELFIPYPSVSPDSKLVYYSMEQAFDLDKAFYAGVAFLFVLFIGWLVTRFIGIFFHELLYHVAFGRYDWILGGVISLVVFYVALFLVLKLMTFVPVTFVQNLFESSGLSRMIVEHSLFLSNVFENLWVTSIIK